MADEKYLKITLVRSPIGYKKNQGVTARTLGLRKMQHSVVHKATPQILGMVHQISHLVKVEEVNGPEAEASKPAKAEKKIQPKAKAAAGTGDDLTKIEGVGPKMSAALKAAGIDTYAKLAGATQADIRQAIEAAGMRLAPGLASWPEQAELAAKGDWDSLHKLQQRLVGGRKQD